MCDVFAGKSEGKKYPSQLAKISLSSRAGMWAGSNACENIFKQRLPKEQEKTCQLFFHTPSST